MSLTEIKIAIERLSFEERAELAAWLHGWKDDEWDEQMKRDITAGKLGRYSARSRRGHPGRATPRHAVKSRTHGRFWDRFDKLPADAQTLARDKFRLSKRDAFHPSLHFGPLIGNVWSERIGNSYRALARRHGDLAVWFWIGIHEEYNNFIQHLR